MMAAADDRASGTAAPARPLPDYDEPDTGPFWRAVSERVLTYGECPCCAAVVFFPRRVCPNCMFDGVRTRVSTGLGTLYSRTTVHRHAHPFFRARTPYVVALVDLDDGFRMMTWLLIGNDVLAIGERVEVAWIKESEQFWPMFRGVAGMVPGVPSETPERQDQA